MKKRIIWSTCIIFSILIVCIAWSSKPSSPEHTVVHASWPKSYTEIGDLTYDSDIIALVEVTGINKTYYVNNNIPFTDYNVKVVTPIKGADADEQLIITQTGINSKNLIFEIEDDPLLKVGNTYLIFGYNNEVGTVTILSGPQGRFVCNDGKVTSLFLSSEFQSGAAMSTYSANNGGRKQDFVKLNNVEIESVIEQIRQNIH